MGVSASTRNPDIRVVIIGGGYGGITAAQALDHYFDVTIVEKRAMFNHCFANLRGVVKPELASSLLIPYDKALTFGRVVRGEVTRIEKSSVVLADGQQLPYNYLIIATGRRMNPLARLQVDSVPDAQRFFNQAYAAVAGARNITIVGGGSVGVELAGEIRAAFADERKITIVQSGDRLLSGENVSEKFRAQLMQKLDSHRIDVLLNERAIRDGDGSQTIVPGASTLRLASGKSLLTDLQFWVAGVGRPHSDFAALAFPDAIDTSTGCIRVNEFGQVLTTGSEHVFAIGDVAQLPVPEQNLGYFAKLQGQAIAENIIRAARGEKMVPYKTGGPMLFLPLGPSDGLGQLPFGVVWGFLVVAVKSKSLLIDRFWRTLGLTPPAVQ